MKKRGRGPGGGGHRSEADQHPSFRAATFLPSLAVEDAPLPPPFKDPST
jgi:hypothetical protein